MVQKPELLLEQRTFMDTRLSIGCVAIAQKIPDVARHQESMSRSQRTAQIIQYTLSGTMTSFAHESLSFSFNNSSNENKSHLERAQSDALSEAQQTCPVTASEGDALDSGGVKGKYRDDSANT